MLTFSILLSSLLVISLQDFLVFPGMLRRVSSAKVRDPKSLPSSVEASEVIMADGKKIELWRLAGNEDSQSNTKKVALVIHGNGQPLDGFTSYFEWLAKQGFITYAMEFRGFGYSTGWPSLKKITSDASELIKLISQKENVDPKNILPFGISLGSGVAVKLAEEYSSKNLFLVTPYTSLKDAARAKKVLGIFAPFLWNNINSLEIIPKLKNTCIMSVHGTGDAVIPYEHSVKLKAAYQGEKGFFLRTVSEESHNDAFWKDSEENAELLRKCFKN